MGLRKWPTTVSNSISRPSKGILSMTELTVLTLTPNAQKQCSLCASKSAETNTEPAVDPVHR